MSNPVPLTAVACATLWLASAGCDDAINEVEAPQANVDELCPALPEEVEPIADLTVSHAYSRFGGLVLTLSTRALTCDEPAVQHSAQYDGPGLGLTLGLPAAMAILGDHALDGEVHIEFESDGLLSVGADRGAAGIELFSISDSCVTGEIYGVEAIGGPFDGGFRAPRCDP